MMKGLDLKHLALLVIGILMLIKSVWGLAAPESVRKASGWWSRAVGRVNTLMGCLYIALGVALWAVVLVDQSWSSWMLGILGLWCACAAMLYFNVENLQRLMKAVVINRSSLTIRLMFLAALVLSILVIWVAVTGR